MKVTDEMVNAALAAWYPGEWPDDPVFREPQPVGLPDGSNTFGDYAKRDMRRALEAALALVPELRYRAEFAAMAPTAPLPWNLAESFGEPVLIDKDGIVAVRVLGGKDEALRIASMILVAVNTCGGFRAVLTEEKS